MNRRDFFKISSLGLSAIAISGSAGAMANKLFAKAKTNKENFSLELITDKTEIAIKSAEAFFKKHFPTSGTIRFSEFELTGESIGDLVFITKGKLLNYKNDEGKIGNALKQIANSLELPKKLLNPTRIKFDNSNENSPATKFLIFHKNILIKTIEADGSNFNLNVQGTKGYVGLGFDKNKVRVTSSNCLHKTCINSGSISLSGESIVCIPNELMILCE